MASTRKPARSKGGRSADSVGEALAAALERSGARGARLCVALSGGVDSVVLLHGLHALAGRYALKLSALHVNHGLSPDAYAWERHCRALCEPLGVALAVRRVKILARRKDGPEAAARKARYAALARARADFVVLAHQLDDQAGTVLMNLLRGAGLRGAAAMREVGPLPADVEGAPLALRPLLGVPRELILAHAVDHGLRWVEDASNADEALSRNWLRRRVGPLLAARYPRWRESLARAAAHFAEADGLLSTEGLLSTDAPERLSAETLRAVPAARAKLLLRGFLRAAGVRSPSARRLDEMLRQAIGSPHDAGMALAYDGKVLRSFRGQLAVLPAASVQGDVVLHACRGAGIAAAKLKERPVSVRARQGGERLRLSPNRPSRTLKNLFQEAGIAPWERAGLPLLYCGEDLVWVPGLGIAAAYRARAGQAGLLPEWARPVGVRPG